jgi:DNA polymerase-3 subunit epsilon
MNKYWKIRNSAGYFVKYERYYGKKERIIFENDIERIEKLKEWGIANKTLQYKGNFKPEECKIVGYIKKIADPKNCNSPFYETIIIKVNGKISKLNIEYFKQMQLNKFKL